VNEGSPGVAQRQKVLQLQRFGKEEKFNQTFRKKKGQGEKRGALLRRRFGGEVQEKNGSQKDRMKEGRGGKKKH